jgi:hypothetical protein
MALGVFELCISIHHRNNKVGGTGVTGIVFTGKPGCDYQ